MKVIFLGLLFCDESLERALETSKCGIQYAPHLFQKNLLEGLENQDVELTVFNVPPMGSFPINSKELFSGSYIWGENRQQIPFVNIPIFKHFEQRYKILHTCRKVLRKTKEPVAVVIYSPYDPFLFVCKKLKEEFSNVCCCMILTDPIPGKGDLARFMTASAVKKGEQIIADSKCIDGFVVLTRYLADSVQTEGRPYDVIECICNHHQKKASVSPNSRNVVLYCGTLEKEYGILDMAYAFSQIQNAELRIYGKGNAEAELEKLSQEFPNIKFLGFADQQVIEKERDACDFLINPRRPTGTFTKYSFPSKTAEYMTSGKPVIMYKLEGVPDEYDPYLNYLSATEPSAIAEELRRLFDEDYSYLLEKAQKSRAFMLREKSSTAQGKRVIKLLERIIEMRI